MIEVHITHNDADAVGCAVVANMNPYRSFQDHTYFCDIGEPDRLIPELLKGEEISYLLITDISVSEETANLIDQYKSTHNIVVEMYDHHPSNTLPEKHNWATVVEKYNYKPISAALLLYEWWRDQHLFDKEIEPLIYNFAFAVSRYDTWEWKRDPEDYSEEYTNIMIRTFGIEETTDKILKSIKNDGVIFTKEDMKIIEAYRKNRENSFKRIERKTAFMMFNEYQIAVCFPTDQFGNAEMERIYLEHPEVDIVFGLYPDTHTISFRTNKDDVNLTRFAKNLFGGGGHAKASGARVNPKEFLTLMERYYTAMDAQRKAEAEKKAQEQAECQLTPVEILEERIKRTPSAQATEFQEGITYYISNEPNAFKLLAWINAGMQYRGHKRFTDTAEAIGKQYSYSVETVIEYMKRFVISLLKLKCDETAFFESMTQYNKKIEDYINAVQALK